MEDIISNRSEKFTEDWLCMYVIWTTYCKEAWHETEVQDLEIINKFKNMIRITEEAKLMKKRTQKIGGF